MTNEGVDSLADVSIGLTSGIAGEFHQRRAKRHLREGRRRLLPRRDHPLQMVNRWRVQILRRRRTERRVPWQRMLVRRAQIQILREQIYHAKMRKLCYEIKNDRARMQFFRL